jgi:hypothetical protein
VLAGKFFLAPFQRIGSLPRRYGGKEIVLNRFLRP